MEQSSNLLTSGQMPLYDEEYYRCHLGPDPYDRSNTAIVNFFAVVADQIIRSLRPARVLDAGCAMGFLVEAFWDRGVEAWGIDISDYAISKIRRDMAPYCRVASLTEPLEGTYDLITCIEVLEHLSEADSVAAIHNMATVGNAILFSSSPTDLTEPTHINVHQPLWWLEQFQQAGFAPDLTYDASYITPHAYLLRKTQNSITPEVLRLFCELIRFKLAHAEQTRLLEPSQLQSQHSAKEQIQVVQSTVEAQAAELAELRRSTSSMMERHVVLLRELERIAAGDPSIEKVRSDIITELNSHLEAVREEIASVRATAERISSEGAVVHKEIRTGLASLSQQVNEVLHSRIWQTLMRAGGLLLRFRGRG